MRVWAALTEKGQELLHQYASSGLSGDGSEGLSGSPGIPKGWSSCSPWWMSYLCGFPPFWSHSHPPGTTHQAPASLSLSTSGGTKEGCAQPLIYPQSLDKALHLPELVTLSQNPGRRLAHLQGSCDKEGEPAPQWLETCFGALFPKMWPLITQNHLQEKADG